MNTTTATATALTASLETALVQSNWIVTDRVLSIATALHGARAELTGSPRSHVSAMLIWLRKMAIGSRINYSAQRNALFATSGVRLLAADHAATVRVQAMLAA